MLSVPIALPALEPSFDCAEASGGAEAAVCASDDLAALDLELARIYGLALNGPGLTPERAAELRGTQGGWTKGRDACWKEKGGLDACIAAEYALRIHAIRMGYADARGADETGGSTGAFAYGCEGLDALVSAVFVNVGTAMVSLRWRQDAIVLPQVRAASGARYQGDTYGGPATFWMKGNTARFTTPGGEEVACTVEPTG